MNEVCAECPFVAACEVARELADNPNHPKRQDALGGIDATEFAIRGIVERIGCDGPTITLNGQKVCPNDTIALFSRSMGIQAWPNTPVQLSTYQDIQNGSEPFSDDSRPVPGQYL